MPPVMRCVSPLLCAAAIASAGPAHAQDQGCSAKAPSVVWTIAVRNADGTFTTFPRQNIGNIINAAECECDSPDLFLQGRVYTAISRPVTPSVWVGTSCNVITSQPTNCEQITPTVSQSNFYPGSSSGLPNQAIPVRSLLSPKTTQNTLSGQFHICPESASIANSEFILFPFDPANPEYCAVLLTAKTTRPSAATDLVAASGDGALRLTWKSPPFGTADSPLFFQVLCADENGDPIPGQGAYGFNQTIDVPHQLAYTTCVDPANHTIERRYMSTAGTPSESGGVADGGVTMTASALDVTQTPVDGGGLTDAGSPPVPSTPATRALAAFDQKFVVSDPIRVIGIDNSFRVSGLSNGVGYTCVVLAIDNWGNPAPSNFASATPQPVQNLYRRFLAEGGTDQGFCFVATAAFGSPQHPYVTILREFRDQVLEPSPHGRAFIAWYYRTSPPYAAWIGTRPVARFVVRAVLWPIIFLAWAHLRLPAWIEMLAALTLGALVARYVARLLRRRIRRSPAVGAP